MVWKPRFWSRGVRGEGNPAQRIIVSARGDCRGGVGFVGNLRRFAAKAVVVGFRVECFVCGPRLVVVSGNCCWGVSYVCLAAVAVNDLRQAIQRLVVAVSCRYLIGIGEICWLAGIVVVLPGFRLAQRVGQLGDVGVGAAGVSRSTVIVGVAQARFSRGNMRIRNVNHVADIIIIYDYFELAKTNPDWASFQFTTEEGGLVEKAELESAGLEMDSNVFRQEFDAQFTTIGRHRAYLSFDRASNVCEVRFVGTEPLVWSLDFNVDPMCMLLMQRVQDDIYVLEEIVIRPDATTEKACRALIERVDPYTKLVHWMHAPLALRIYGDASGHQRRTAGSATDWNQIREFFHMHKGFVEPSFYFASANPLVRDRVNCVNARLRNSDALGYFVSQAFPLRGTFGTLSA